MGLNLPVLRHSAHSTNLKFLYEPTEATIFGGQLLEVFHALVVAAHVLSVQLEEGRHLPQHIPDAPLAEPAHEAEISLAFRSNSSMQCILIFFFVFQLRKRSQETVLLMTSYSWKVIKFFM